VFERHENADVARRRIGRAEESDDENERKIFRARKRRARSNHGKRADGEKLAQIETRREITDRERQKRRAEQRRRRDNPDLKRRKAQFGEVGRQDDDGETVTETARCSRGIEQREVRWPPHHPAPDPLLRARLNGHRMTPVPS